MRGLLKRVALVFVMSLSLFVLSSAPTDAYCNDNPCQTNRHIVCTMCTYFKPVPGGVCRITVIYCVHCQSGDILSWEENVDFCEYWVI